MPIQQGFDDEMRASAAADSDPDTDVVNDFDTVLFVLLPGDTGTRIKERNRGKCAMWISGENHTHRNFTSKRMEQAMEIPRYRKAAYGAALMSVSLLSIGTSVQATSHSMTMSDTMMTPGLILPPMNAASGRLLFASKGCVVCHSVNGIGGVDARMLDAKFMDQPMNPFNFAARMWRGAETMVKLQREELGGVIQISGQELADIIAFVHDPDEQERFSGADIPDNIRELMEHSETEEEDAHD